MFKSSLFILILFSTTIFGQASIDIPLTVTDNGTGSKVLQFGLDLNATNGIDPALGESDLPPFPPAGVSEIRFNLTPYNNEYLSSYQDYRNAPSFPFSGTVQHRLWWQLSTGATAITISYNLPSYATLQIQDLSGGSLINSPVLSGSGSFEINIAGIISQVNVNVVYTGAGGTTGTDDNLNFRPKEYNLMQNFPNPFNPVTTIRYAVPFESNVKIILYNLLGRKMSEIVNNLQPAGYYDISYDASLIPTGVYFYKIEANSVSGLHSFVSVKKMIILK